MDSRDFLSKNRFIKVFINKENFEDWIPDVWNDFKNALEMKNYDLKVFVIISENGLSLRDIKLI